MLPTEQFPLHVCVVAGRVWVGAGPSLYLVGLSAPILLMAVALGVEVSSWTVTKQKLQRTADMAALAAAEAYFRGASVQTATIYGSYVAEMNGTSPDMVTVQSIAGVVNSSDTAFQATVQIRVPLLFSAYALPEG